MYCFLFSLWIVTGQLSRLITLVFKKFIVTPHNLAHFLDFLAQILDRFHYRLSGPHRRSNPLVFQSNFLKMFSIARVNNFGDVESLYRIPPKICMSLVIISSLIFILIVVLLQMIFNLVKYLESILANSGAFITAHISWESNTFLQSTKVKCKGIYRPFF